MVGQRRHRHADYRPRRFGKTLTMSMFNSTFKTNPWLERAIMTGITRVSKDGVKRWYDGFIFGNHPDIYNPWSILNFLDKGRYGTYWANTSANSLVGKLLREGN